MKIELKNIKVFKQMSHETTCFAADIFINDANAGVAVNHGHGGPTEYSARNKAGADLIEKAAAYCKGLPPDEFKVDDEEYKLSMDLELFIDNLLIKYLNEKEILKFRKNVDRLMKTSIVYGIPDQECAQMIFNKPVEVMLAQPKGTEFLKTTIIEKVVPKLKNGYLILNTNIPEEIFKAVGLNNSQYLMNSKTSLGETKKVKKNIGRKP